VAAPSGLTATPGNHQVTLTWRPNTEAVLSHYVIYRSATASALGDSVGRVDKTGATFTNAGLAAGTYYFVLRAVDATGVKSGLSSQISATLAPILSLPATPLLFGNVRVGSSGTRTLVISNPGTATLTISSIAADSAQFAVSPTSLTINAGDSATVTVTFTPASSRAVSATLSVIHTAPGSPAALRLSGTGLKPTLTHWPDRFHFGNVARGAEVGLPFTFSNAGNDTLRVDTLRVVSPGNAFSLAPRIGFVLAPYDTQSVAVVFHPTDSGEHAGGLTVSCNDPGKKTLSIPLDGFGVTLSLWVDLNPAEGNQRQATAGGVQPGKRVPLQLFVDGAPQVKGFMVRLTFDPRKLAFVTGSFVAGPLVPGLAGLANVQKDFVEIGGAVLGSGTGGGSGLLGALSIEALQGFDREATLRVPLVVWNHVTGGRQEVQTDLQIRLTRAGGLAGDFNEDGEVGFEDFFLFAGAFGQKAAGDNAKFDLDGDGEVSFGDFFAFAGEFGKKVE
jgi:hypothetical protein